MKPGRATAAAPGSAWPSPSGRSRRTVATFALTTAPKVDRCSASFCRSQIWRSVRIRKSTFNPEEDRHETLRFGVYDLAPAVRVGGACAGHSGRVPTSTHNAWQAGRLQGECAQGQYSAQRP